MFKILKNQRIKKSSLSRHRFVKNALSFISQYPDSIHRERKGRPSHFIPEAEGVKERGASRRRGEKPEKFASTLLFPNGVSNG